MTNKFWTELTDLSAEQLVGGTDSGCYNPCPPPPPPPCPPPQPKAWIPPGLGKNNYANYKGQGAVKTEPPNPNWFPQP
jgi:hypothetical protein